MRKEILPRMLVSICAVAGVWLIPAKSEGQNLRMTMDGEYPIVESENLDLTYLDAVEFQSLDWEPGFAYYPDGNSKAFDGLKYDPEFDRMYVQQEGTVLPIFPGIVTGISMEGERVTHLFLKVIIKEKPVFMEALAVGDIHLLVYRFILMDSEDDKKKTTVNPQFVFEERDRVIRYSEKLYTWNRDGIRVLKVGKKNILQLFGENADEIEAYIDSNHLKIKDFNDLGSIFQKYNELRMLP